MSLFINGVNCGGGVFAPELSSRTAVVAPRIVMPVGDSVTRGYGPPGSGGYREPLFRLCCLANKPVDFVGSASHGQEMSVNGYVFPKTHQGFDSYTIPSIAAILNAALSAYTPEIVLLHAGVAQVCTANQTLIDAAPQDLRNLLDQIHAARASCNIIVAKIIPPANGSLEPGYVSFNATIDATVAARSSYCTLVDMWTAFKANPSFASQYYVDEIHPNAAGFDVMAAVWNEALNG